MEDQSSEQESYSQEWCEDQNVWHEDSGPGGTEWHEGQWDSHNPNSTSWETPNEYRFIVAASSAEYWRKHPDVGRSGSLCSRKVGPEHHEDDQREDRPVKSQDHIWCGHGSVPYSGFLETILQPEGIACIGIQELECLTPQLESPGSGTKVDVCWWQSKRRENRL